MITIEQLKDVKERTDALRTCRSGLQTIIQSRH